LEGLKLDLSIGINKINIIMEYFPRLIENEFERGRDPLTSLDLGLYQKVFRETSKDLSEGGAYAFSLYGPKNWKDIISWLKEEGYTPGEVEQILRSKLMRWASDLSDNPSNTTLDDFKRYDNGVEVKKFIDKYGPWVNEEAMGGVSSPMSTLNNTPGMGNAAPAAKATTGSMGDSNTGSGDNWDSSTGIKPAVQEKMTFIREEVDKIMNEQNINPHDKLGVAMAKKMGINIPFEKGKGDKDVKQKEIDEDIDLSTKLVSFEEWAKKFVNESFNLADGDFSFVMPELANWEDPKGELVYIRTNDKRYPYEHVFYNAKDDLAYFYNEEDKHSIAYPRDQVQANNWALPWIQKYIEENGKNNS
jgi:hypothetical protein